MSAEDDRTVEPTEEPPPEVETSLSAAPEKVRSGKRSSFTTERVSAGAAVAGVVVTAIGIYVASQTGNDPAPVPQAQIVVLQTTTGGVEAEGDYKDLDPRSQDLVVMFRPAEDGSGDWNIVVAQRASAGSADDLASGQWQVVIPVDPTQPWETAVAVVPASVTGDNAAAHAELEELRAEGPESDVPLFVSEEKVSTPSG